MLERGLIYENLERFLRPMEGHGTPLLLAPLYYPAVIALAFAPWTLHLVFALRKLAPTGAPTSAGGALLLAWLAVPLVVFTLSATKLPHYVFPAWPALALAVAVRMCGERESACAPHSGAAR